MKKIFLLTISILMVNIVFAKTGNPIPSYNFLLTSNATFQENNPGGPVNYNHPSDEKRDMDVTNGASGNGPTGGCSIVVYIYRLDNSIVLGPYSVPSGQTLTVPIDGNAWGVAVSTNSPTYISVWADGNPQ